MKTIIKKFPSLSIFLLSLVAFMASQYKEGITNYITRFVDFANYTLQHGMTLFPMQGPNDPFPDYTITSTAFVYFFSLPFGKLSVTSLGLPFSLAASLMVVFTYKIGELHDKKWGRCAALFTFLSWQFIQEVHFLALDVYAAFATVLCFYLVYASHFLNKRSYLFFLPLGFIIGFLFRGPIGLITPALIVCCYYLLSQQWKLFFIVSVIAGLLLIACTALLAWAAYIQGGLPFMKLVLQMQGLGRIVNEHAPRLYFYFTIGVLAYAFTALFALTVIVKKFKHIFSWQQQDPKLKLLLSLCVWFFVVILFFTIPNSKKARYILSITPAISLIAAYIFMEKNVFAKAITTLKFICLNMPVFGLISLLFIASYNYFAVVHLYPYFRVATIGFLGLLMLRPWIKSYEKSPHYDVIIMVFGVVTFLFLNTVIVYPINYHLELLTEPDPKFLPFFL